MRRPTRLAWIALAIIVASVCSASASPTQQASEARYVVGLEASVTGACLTGTDGIGVGGACDLTCPVARCLVRVEDDVHSRVTFRLCVDGEDWCRGWIYDDYAYVSNVAGKTFDIRPAVFSATTGVATVHPA